MTRYVITGTDNPDCTTPNTGDPAGTHESQPYWSWVNGATTYYLFLKVNYEKYTQYYWCISTAKPMVVTEPTWLSSEGVDEIPSIVDEYTPVNGASGTVTVAELLPTLSARLMLVIESSNGQPINSPCMIPLSEIRT